MQHPEPMFVVADKGIPSAFGLAGLKEPDGDSVKTD